MASSWSGFGNAPRLLDHGPVELRAAALEIIETGIRAADPYSAALDLLRLDGERLILGPEEYDLREIDNIYVIGAGKATQPIVEALEYILGDRLTEGVVSLKRGEPHRLNRVRIVAAAHPVPDEESYRASQEVVALARKAGQKDIVFSAITGGSSALMVWPVAGITLEDKQELNKLLLTCGASIREINAVRKHVSRVKGGRLGSEVFPATLINLTVSDVAGDPLDYITGPTVPDTSTFRDAWHTLSKYDLWDRVPGSIRKHLERGEAIETPKSYSGKYSTHVIVPGDAACVGAMMQSKALGYTTRILTTVIEGESSWEAKLLYRK